MSPALWLMVIPLGTAPLVYLLRRMKLGAGLAVVVAWLLAWLALRIAPGDVLSFFGRVITLEPLAQGVLVVTFGATALLFLLQLLTPEFSGGTAYSRIQGREEKFFYPVGLVTLALFVAASLTQHLGITAILMMVAAILITFVIQGERLDSTRAAQRFLMVTALAVPLFLLAAHQIDLYQLSAGPRPVRVLEQIALLTGLGFALWLAITPFHSWLTTVAAESSPITAAFVLIAFPNMALLTLLQLLADLPQLVDVARLLPLMVVAGGITAILGGLLTSIQRSYSELLGYAALHDVGAIVVLLASNGQDPYLLVLTAMLVRTIALTLVAGGMAALRADIGHEALFQIHGWAWRNPMAAFGLTLGGLTLAGMPLTAGFALRWQLLQSLGEGGVFMLGLAGLGVAIGYLRGLRAALLPSQSRTIASNSNWGGVGFGLLMGLLIVICIGLGLFPGWLLDQIEPITRAVILPVW